MERTRHRRKRKSIDEIIKEAKENAPKIHAYTIRQLAEIVGKPWTTPRWHIERGGKDYGGRFRE